MKEQIINRVMLSMYEQLNERQIESLKSVLYVTLYDYTVVENTRELVVLNDSWQHDLGDFLASKKMEGRTESTITQYKKHLFKLLSYLNKDVKNIGGEDIFLYMRNYKSIRKVGNRYMEDIRLVFSSFFSWEIEQNRISLNPVKIVKKIKYDQKIRKPFSDEELELLLRKCETERDCALMEFLYSTGVRVSELSSLNINDICFSDKELVVYGKGGKERFVYLNAKTCVHLKKYLKSRSDTNEALFVSLNDPHKRFGIAGIELRLKKIGRSAGVENVHPHRFRRTTVTNALNRGMPMQEISQMVGHSNIQTTQIYSMVSQYNIKHSHNKYLSA